MYTFTTAKLQPLVTQPEGKNLIQACLNAPHGSLPSSMPVGAPIGRSSGPMSMPGPQANNIPGGLSIGGQPAPPKEDDGDEEEEQHARTGDKRRRRGSATNRGGGPGSPQSPNAVPPAPLSIPAQPQHQQQHHQQAPPPQIALGSPTSPQHQHQQVPPSPQYNSPTSAYGQQHHQQHHGQQPSPTDPGMYGGHMMPPQYSYPGPNGPAQGGQPLGGLAAAAAQHGHWAPGPAQPQAYGRR